MVKKYIQLVVLMLAGEVIFLLPFVVTRIFRPTFLEVFHISNFELGSAFSVYGIVAMISYFFGGPLADRYSPKRLLTFSLLLTSAAGVWLASIPSVIVLTVLYGFWGLSTIFFFWAAYTKVTRQWGGISDQGKAFGLVDGGRGLVAAIIASSSVLLLSVFLPIDASLATAEALQKALSYVIYLFSGLTFIVAFLVWWLLEESESNERTTISIQGILEVIKKRSVWYQGLIILCAYVAYKCTDDFSLYASVVLDFDDVEAAQLATVAFWCRPVAAVMAGFLGDKYVHSNVIIWCFTLIILMSFIISIGWLKPDMILLSVLSIASVSMGIFGLRGLYFALLEESKIPISLTGAAVGVVSVIGFTPDVFFGPFMGFLLDEYPGSLGHQYLFGALCVFAAIGLFATWQYKKSGI